MLLLFVQGADDDYLFFFQKTASRPLGHRCRQKSPQEPFRIECTEFPTMKSFTVDAHILLLHVLQKIQVVTGVRSFRFGGHLPLYEKSDFALKAPGAPRHIGEFDRYSVPFAFIAAAYDVTAPERYSLIRPLLKSRLFTEARPTSDGHFP